MASLLTLSLLGGFHLEWGGEPVTTFESNKVRALLAYLAVEGAPSRHTPHQRSVVASLLWPDSPEEIARTNLRHVLHQLRQSLPDVAGVAPLLLTGRQTIQLNPQADLEVDVNRFRALLALCERCSHRTPDECPACRARYTEAAALYHGEFLAGLMVQESDLFEEWVVVQREGLHHQALLVFFTLAAWHEAQGNYEQALAYARRQLVLEPWREEAHRQTMRILARTGQQTAALAQYAQCRKTLADELGVEPDAEIGALYEQIRSGKLGKEIRGQGDRETRRQGDEDTDRSIQNLKSKIQNLQDWGEAPANSYFYGREAELAQLKQWLVGERCRLVTVLALGGMGKSTLVTRAARALTDEFAFVFWRSLLNAPPLNEILRDLLRFLSHQQLGQLPESLSEQSTLLFQSLRQHRCLLVLDNVESILEAGQAGQYRVGYEGYGQLIERMAQSEHQSCLVLTSRERPRGIEQLEEDLLWVRTLLLSGLAPDAGGALLKTRGLTTDAALVEAVVQRYSGNPLALKLVARTIQELFDGNIVTFLSDETLIFDDIRSMLDQQFARLTPLEREILLWLAIEREAISLQTLVQNLVHPPARRDLLESLQALQRRSLLEKTNAGFALQNVVTEYLTDYLVDQVCKEIADDRMTRWQGDKMTVSFNHHVTLSYLNRHALLKAQAKEYVRESQVRLVLAPIAKRLVATLGQARLLLRVRELLNLLRAEAPLTPGYSAGNLLNLLLHIEADLNGYDFSHLAVWQASLRGRNITDIDFTGADLTGSTFSDTFGVIGAVAYSPNGQWLLAATTDGELRLWQADTMQPVRIIPGHARPINTVVFDAHGDRFASGGNDFTIRLWETATGRPLQTLHGHNGWVRSIAFSPDGQTLASASSDQSICLWHLASGEIRHRLLAHRGHVRAVAFHPAGKLLASGGADHTVRLWNPESGQLLDTRHAHTAAVMAIAFSPDGQMLASSGADQTICLWNLQTRHHQILTGHTSDIRCLAFSPDGQILASSSADYTVRLWDLPPRTHGRIRHPLHGHTRGVNSIAFHPDGETLVSGSDDHTIRFWNVQSGQARNTLHGHTGWMRTVSFSPDGALLASGSDDALVRLWDVERGQVRHTLHGHHHWIWSMAFSPRGDLLATGGADHLFCLWNVQNGRNEQILPHHTSTVRSLAFSPDGVMLATGCADHLVRLWDAQRGQLLYTLAGHSGWVQAIAFSPDGALLASASNDHTVRLWNVRSQRNEAQLFSVLNGHTAPVMVVAFSPDGALVASAGEDRIIYVWDAQTGAVYSLLHGHEKEVNAIVFSPDGSLLASGSSDHTVRLWDVQRRQTRYLLSGHTAWIRTLAFSPDGQTLVSGSADNTIHLWDTQLGTLRHVLRGHEHWVWSIAFRVQGDLLASGSVDATIRLWDIQTGLCKATLRPRAPYAGMKISGVTGISYAQKAALRALGAVEE
jgi:WD40 repeat protein/DNA-binding SARP family transcriptional activator